MSLKEETTKRKKKETNFRNFRFFPKPITNNNIADSVTRRKTEYRMTGNYTQSYQTRSKISQMNFLNNGGMV